MWDEQVFCKTCKQFHTEGGDHKMKNRTVTVVGMAALTFCILFLVGLGFVVGYMWRNL